MAETRTPRKASANGRKTAPGQHEKMMAGRTQAALMRRYLEALKAEKAPKKKGRRRTPEQINAKIASIDAVLEAGTADPLKELELRQERLLLSSELQAIKPAVASADFEEDFIQVAKEYGERKGIAYEVWREIGVPVVLLRKAGITR